MVNARRRVRRLFARTFILATLLCLLLPAAARIAPVRADTPVYGGTLTIGYAIDFDDLDPAANSANETIWMVQNLYERLVQPSVDGTRIEPQLAKTWDISKDNLTYTFHLRKAVFHNGQPVTAADVVWSLYHCINYKGGWGFLFTAVKKITAPDASTVVIMLTHPWAPLLADLAIYATGVVPANLAQKMGHKLFETHPIGSGPYEFSSWDKGSQLVLKRNPNWWGPRPYLDTVIFKAVPNDNTRVLQLQGGQADVIENPPANLLTQISANPKLQVDLFPSTRVDFLELNENYKPLHDKLIRQALNYAVDKNAIIKIALSGHGEPAATFMPKMLYWNPNVQPYPYDLAKAKALMAKSSFPHGFKATLVEVSNDVPGNAAAVIIKSELAQIGVDVTIQTYELITAYRTMDAPNSNMGQRYWTNDIIDPDEVTSFAADPGAGDDSFKTRYNNPVVTNLIHQAQTTLDPAKRRAEYYQIQQIVHEDAQLLFLYYSPYRYAHATYVHGFMASPLGTYRLKDVWIGAH